jgi:tetratricopeptide (TPR) repeat protein
MADYERAPAKVALWPCVFVAALGLGSAHPCFLRAQAPGLGRISFPTSGSPAAQPHFIRGVLLLHNFEYDDAIEAFRDAQRVDPAFVMAYWGEAMCYNQSLWLHEEVAKARDALARLRMARATARVTAREQRYVDAVESLVGTGDKAARDRAYADKMGDLARAYPDDDEAAAFYALALLATVPPTQPNADVSLKAGAIAATILEKNPQHPGAAHYALHAYGDGQHAAMGLKAARIYARIAPASSHARHMPSHVFLPLGMWDEAAMADESAFAASTDWVKRHGASPAQLDFHSLSWLQYEYLQQGRFAKARELLEPIRQALMAPAADRHTHVESEIGRGFAPVALKSELASMRARLIVESGSWSEMKGRGTFDNVDELFALGLASAKLGDLARAEAALEHMGKAIDAAPDPDNRQLARIMQLELTGMLKAATGATTEALAALKESAAMEASRPRPNARPYPIKPAGELYAETLLAAGNARAAVKAFQTSLVRTPRRAASLIGLARAAQTAGVSTEARRAAREFVAIWRLADAARPELKEARAIVTPR